MTVALQFLCDWAIYSTGLEMEGVGTLHNAQLAFNSGEFVKLECVWVWVFGRGFKRIVSSALRESESEKERHLALLSTNES